MLLHLRVLYQRVEVVVSSTIKATQMPMVEAEAEGLVLLLQPLGLVIHHQFPLPLYKVTTAALDLLVVLAAEAEAAESV